MEIVWLIIIIIISLIILFLFIISSLSKTPLHPHLLPPGPHPITGTLLWLRASFTKQLQPLLFNLHAKHGPIITLPFISLPPPIFISHRSLAHQALIQNAAVFADRPHVIATSKLINSTHHNISSSRYGATWRTLRRNLTTHIIHPTRSGLFSGSRTCVLESLIQRLQIESQSHSHVILRDYLLHSVFALLSFMCFGEKLNDEQIDLIKQVQRRLFLNYDKFLVLNFWPKTISRLLLRSRWEEYTQLRKDQADVMRSLITKAKNDNNVAHVTSYVESLLSLEWPEEKRRLNDEEIVTLASEFLNAGTDTTATALEWVMANLVKHPYVQEKIVEEIRTVMKEKEEEDSKIVKEEYLHKMPYLKCVILERLRRHPPVPALIPHRARNDVVLSLSEKCSYMVPKNAVVNFVVAKMGWDPEVWENPMEFKPERFSEGGVNNNNNELEGFDIGGSNNNNNKEIKMMPRFGAGWRMCPGVDLAMLHMEFFVANLVWNFQWKSTDDVDLSEKQELTMVMKNPLCISLFPRF